MTAWADLFVGGPILTENAFGDGYELDTTKTLAGGIIGVQPGFSGDPFGGMTYPTDGDYKMGRHLQFHQNYATGYTPYEHVTDQSNNEQIFYPHPHTPALHSGFMDSFDVDGGDLLLKARPSTQAERDSWCRFKGYLIGLDGQAAKAGYLKSIYTTAQLQAWGAGDLTDDDAEVFFQNAPSDWVGAMLSTYNRHSASFARSGITFTVPAGGRLNGDGSDLSKVEGWFPAFWPLEDVPARCDINGRPHDLDTYTPGNPQAGGLLSELDGLELFATFLLHITSHLYKDGNLALGVVRATGGRSHWEGSPVQYNTSQTLVLTRDTPVTVTVDRFPPNGAFPGVICYGINGVVMFLQQMSDHLGAPKIVYEPVGGNRPYLPFVDPDTALVTRLGTQTYAENGLPAYTHYCDIFNISQIASFSRPGLRDEILAGTAPSFRENETMRVSRHFIKPLIDDNPDSRPYINYTAGESGGSGPIIGPIDGGTVTTPEVADTGLNPRLVIQIQPMVREGRPAQQIRAIPKDGYDPAGKSFTWASSIPELTFSPQGSLVTTPSLSGLSTSQLASITLDDGEA